MFPGNRKKQVGDSRIELRTPVFHDFRLDYGKGERLAIRSVGRHGIQRVNNSEDAGADWNLLPFELFRVAGAIKTLMVAEDDLGRFL